MTCILTAIQAGKGAAMSELDGHRAQLPEHPNEGQNVLRTFPNDNSEIFDDQKVVASAVCYAHQRATGGEEGHDSQMGLDESLHRDARLLRLNQQCILMIRAVNQ